VRAVSGNGRYFIDQFGDPILVKGDTPWSAFADLTVAQWTTYCSTRASQGFNLAVVDLVSSDTNGGPNADGTDYAGQNPFVGGDITNLNTGYWSRVDSMVTVAENYGITLNLYPINYYSTYVAGKAFNGKTATACQSYGALMGTRYGSRPNVIWCYGNDYQDWPAFDTQFDAVVAGVASTASVPVTSCQLDYHLSYTHESAHWAGQTTWNYVYAYPVQYDACKVAWDANVGPALLGEAAYIGEAYTGGDVPLTIRKQIGWALTSGSCGDIAGTEDWGFVTGWDTRLSRTEIGQVSALRAIFEAVQWWTLVPVTNLLSSGAGTRVVAQESGLGSAYWPAASDYASGAVSADGKLAMVYLPAQRAITVNTALLRTSPVGMWLNASTGASTSIPDVTVSITPPAAGDWVLKITAT
jgi:hypothetical protein